MLTGIGIASIYDGFNEFEYCGGAGRFFRSLKIATEISADYAWNLYSLQENTKEYNEVSFYTTLEFYFLIFLLIKDGKDC